MNILTRPAFIGLIFTLPLAGCTTLLAGLQSAPPGIDPRSFRECLISNGFFESTALVGLSGDNYLVRHRDDKAVLRDPHAIMAMNDAAFVVRSTKIVYDGLLAHQQYGGIGWSGAQDDAHDPAKSLGETDGLRPYGLNLVPQVNHAGQAEWNGTATPAKAALPDADIARHRPDNRLNLYLDCYIGPVGAEDPATTALGLPVLAADKTDHGEADVEGRLLRGHIIVALLARYGTELVTSHASGSQSNYAAMLLRDIISAEMELRLASPVINTDNLAKAGLVDKIDAKSNAMTYTADEFVATGRPDRRWYDSTTRVLRVFQLGADNVLIDAKQTLDRVTNLIAAFAGKSLTAFKDLLGDSLKGFTALQKVKLYGDALIRDGRESLAVHRLNTRYVAALKADKRIITPARFTLTDATIERREWAKWDQTVAEACSVLKVVAKDDAATCLPTPAALTAEFDRRTGSSDLARGGNGATAPAGN